MPLKVPSGLFYYTGHKKNLSRLTFPSRAFVKAASPDDGTAMENMKRELQTYNLPGVASTECFRKMYDVIDNRTIALEWLDITLAGMEYKPDKYTYSLIASVLRATLTSCVVLGGHGYVNTGRSPVVQELAVADNPRL